MRSPIPATVEWLSPPELVRSLGEFDLDPCSPVSRPWDTAKVHYTKLDDGLVKPWFGRVWMNPPYTSATIGRWLKKQADHGNGISLLFARVDRKDFHEHIFNRADSILFLRGRVHFHFPDGSRATENGGYPSMLVAFGEGNCEALETCGIPGRHLPVGTVSIVVAGFDSTWRVLIKAALIRLQDPSSVAKVVETVASMAPDKVRGNVNYRAKVRQVLRRHFDRLERGVYAKPA